MSLLIHRDGTATVNGRHIPSNAIDAILQAQREDMVVSRFQARAALAQRGLLATAEDVVAGADTVTQLAWSEAVEFRRLSPAIMALAPALGLTESDLDDIFRAAAEIEV